MSEKDLKIYLEILLGSIKMWSKDPDHEFIVVFPKQYEEKLKAVEDAFRKILPELI